MRKTTFLVFIAILLAIPIVPTFAETLTLHMNGKVATAWATDGSSYAMVTVSEMTRPTKMTNLQFMLQDPSNGVFIIE